MQLEQAAIERYLARLHGGGVQIESLSELNRATTGAGALKAFGYGRPLRVAYRVSITDRFGLVHTEQRAVVLRSISTNGFGRERDDDRFAEIWLDWATFNDLSHHTHAQDVIALTNEGQLESLREVQDLMLVTDYAPGQPYADDLLRIRDSGTMTERDMDRVEVLAEYLASIHAVKRDDPLLWRRRLRDLVGHGEGIMGLTDSYPAEYAPANADDLQQIEAAANSWRWRLKPLTHRLSQVHGDFHPFNMLFSNDTHFTLLDRSRGAWGEPADDVSCMAINYLFFSLQRYGKLAGPFADLHTAFWTRYLERSEDHELLHVVQPWLAWRVLVLASPQWYPTLTDSVRSRLFSFAHAVLSMRKFDWYRINSYLE